MSTRDKIIDKILADCNFSDFSSHQKALVTISGGLDSTVLLYFILHLGLDVVGIEFNYPLRPKAEQASLQKICTITNTDLITFQYPQIKSSRISDNFCCDMLEANSLHYFIASNFAVANGIEFIFGGLIKDDCDELRGQNSKYLIDRINELVTIEFNHPSKIIMPFISLDKNEVVGLGRYLKVPFEYTWSCEKDLDEPCEACDNCKIRKLTGV